MKTVVHSYYEDNLSLINALESAKEISLLQIAEDSLKKSLALAVGSYFEHEILLLLENYAIKQSNKCIPLTSFIKSKALARQYHTFFDWKEIKESSANVFFGYFGDEFKKSVITEVKSSPDLAKAIKSFIELGQLRNKVAHQNFASFTTDKTSKEIFDSFEDAMKFLDFLHTKFD